VLQSMADLRKEGWIGTFLDGVESPDSRLGPLVRMSSVALRVCCVRQGENPDGSAPYRIGLMDFCRAGHMRGLWMVAVRRRGAAVPPRI
jgi:hypothetical protein